MQRKTNAEMTAMVFKKNMDPEIIKVVQRVKAKDFPLTCYFSRRHSKMKRIRETS